MHHSHYLTFQKFLRAATQAADQCNWEVAAGLFAQAIPLDPSAALIIQYGHMLKEAGYLEAAVGAYRAALVWDGTASDGYVHLGHLLKRLGRTDEAMRVFEAAKRIPYGPHVRAEINGLAVARLNSVHAVRSDKGEGSRSIPESVQHQDEALHTWLSTQWEAREQHQHAARASKPPNAAPVWGRKSISSSLRPAADLVVEQGAYRATTSNPRMCLQPIDRTDVQALAGQWVEIILKIRGTECVIDPILYIEEELGWACFKVVRLTEQADDTYGVITRLPKSIVSLRLDPVHTPGKFTLSELEVWNLSRTSIVLRLLRDPGRPAITELVQATLRGDLEALMENHFATEMVDEYSRWVAFNERPSLAPLPLLVDEGAVGFVFLLSDECADDYVSTLASLRGQTSSRWKLAFVVDESLAHPLRTAIEREAKRDERITVATLRLNASKAARMAAGMALLDVDLIGRVYPGDTFAKEAVASLLECAKGNRATVAIYCDHDEIDEKGRRHSPRFKPNWNADYILCYDYVGPTVLFSRAAIEVVGGWRDKFPDMETFDLLLRISKDAGLDGIQHLAKPLWHCRRTAEGRDILAPVNDHLDQRNSSMRALPGSIPGTAKLKWPMPVIPPHVTLILPTRDRIELVKTAIESILSRTEYPSFDIIVVDNGSVEQESLDYLAEISRDDRISVLRDDGPFNFSRLNNRAAAIAKGALLALVNNDVEVREGNWLREMVSIAIDPSVGAVGAKLLYGSGHVQHAGMVGGVGAVTGHGHKYAKSDAVGYMNRLIVQQTVIAVTAACLVVETYKYKVVGGLDEANLMVSFNDVDLCLKLRERGWRTVFTPWSTLYHHESLSRGLDLSGEGAARFKKEASFMKDEWYAKILNDPFYSSNLTIDHEDFSFGYPTSKIQ